MLEAYAAHLLALAPVTGRRLKVVVDAGNGMAGLTAPVVFERIGATASTWCRCTSSSTAPSRTTRPTRSSPENLVDLQKRVVAEGADIGLAFDGDADRCFVVDERGRAVSPSTLTALIAARELAKEPGASVIHNLITSRAVPELVTELGGTPVRTRVGHSFIKATMAETDAVFGGEHSGHFYFRDFWRADSGMLAALHTLAALAATDRPLSELLADYERYVAQRRDQLRRSPTRRRCSRPSRRRTPRRAGAEIDHLDGLTVTTDDWWFNVRPSNTEPLLRLNVEGADDATMARVRDDVLALIRRDGPMNLDPKLLEIIVCPDCHGIARAGGRGARVPGVRPGLPGPRRHPGAAGRRGPQAGLTAGARHGRPGSTSPGSTTRPRWRTADVRLRAARRVRRPGTP